MEWISVKDGFPEEMEQVAVLAENKEVGFGRHTTISGDSCWFTLFGVGPIDDGRNYTVTHWMPLPHPPFSDRWIVNDYTPDVDRSEPSKFAQKRDIRYECPECGMESKQRTKFFPHCWKINIVE